MTLVALITDRSNYSRAGLIRSVLSDPSFIFIEFNQGVGGEHTLFKSALRRAKEIDPEANCLVIKDTSVTSLGSQEVMDAITSLTSRKFDLAYLASWDDYCQLQVKLDKKDPMRKVDNVRTQRPSGTQAIIFSPNGRDIVLGEAPMANGQTMGHNEKLDQKLTSEIYNGNISAVTTIPHIFEYDIALNALTNDDYLKANPCSPVKMIPTTAKSSSSSNLFWFALIVILVMVVAWAIIKIGPKMKTKAKGKSK